MPNDDLAPRAFEARQSALLAEAARRLDYQVSIGQMLFRALVAVNGGGLITLLLIFAARSALAAGPGKLWVAFSLFLLGMAATIGSGISAFLSQRCYYDVALTPDGAEYDADARRAACIGDRLLIAASVCIMVGALAFFTGAGFAMAGAI